MANWIDEIHQVRILQRIQFNLCPNRAIVSPSVLDGNHQLNDFTSVWLPIFITAQRVHHFISDVHQFRRKDEINRIVELDVIGLSLNQVQEHLFVGKRGLKGFKQRDPACNSWTSH